MNKRPTSRRYNPSARPMAVPKDQPPKQTGCSSIGVGVLLLILVLVARLGGAVDVPCAEIDGTGSSVLMMEIDPASRCFHFELRKKQ